MKVEIRTDKNAFRIAWAITDRCLIPGKLLNGGYYYSESYTKYWHIEEEVCVDPALGPFKFTIRDSSG